jgi:HEAT repeat protein
VGVVAREEEDPGLRALAAALLGDLRAPGTAPPLAEALRRVAVESQADLALEEVAAAVARALGEIGGAEATGAVVELAADPRPVLRRAAIEALGRRCGALALTTIVKAARDPDDAVASAARTARRRCEGGAARPLR